MGDNNFGESTEGREEEKRPRVPLPGEWSDAIDDLIAEAMREGVFDNLAGRGKPLKLSKNPYSPETELAYQLLKDNNYTLPWISERQAVLARIEALRDEIQHVWMRYQAEYRVAHSETVRMGLAVGWHKNLDGWRGQIVELNRLVADANLKQPGAQLEILKLTLEHELARAGARESLDSSEEQA